MKTLRRFLALVCFILLTCCEIVDGYFWEGALLLLIALIVFCWTMSYEIDIE